MIKKARKRILAVILIIAFAVGVFEPVTGYKGMLAEVKNKKNLKADKEQIPEETWEECKEDRTAYSTTYQRTDGKKKTSFSVKRFAISTSPNNL